MVPAPSSTGASSDASSTDAPPTGSRSRDRALASLLYRLDLHRRLAEQRSPLGTADGRLLWLMSDRRPRTLREISGALGLEQSTVNRQVNAAIDAGLLRRFAEAGRPARLIEPTAAGIEAFENATALALGAYDDALATLGDESGAFLELLDRFVGAYGEAVRAE
ncbi:MarR family winged helix-turn-helix transcriptional regulator [Isoptericola cucumis]|uniref:MarR family winged helix-turn-helix transcriptional regulator n=1 Tax=Isoptericola cucumis TaxID=1776856 RepID=UPI003208CF39